MGVIRHFLFGWLINGKQPASAKMMAAFPMLFTALLCSSFYFNSATEAILDCDNVTSAGSISGNESQQGYYDPAVISSNALPAGGSGTIEYLWLKSYSNSAPPPGDASWITIPNSNSPSYDPGLISQTTHYIRCARRSGCSTYAGESNVITKTVLPSPSQCNLENHGPGDLGQGDRLVWLNNTNTNEIKEYAVDGSSYFTEAEDNTATLIGSLVDVSNSNCKWDYHIQLKSKRNWSQWSSQGRTYAANPSCDLHQSWLYYEVDEGNSYMTGKGCNSGITLEITHNPGDFSKGFQIGEGANIKNCEFGLSGWFYFNGNNWTGSGDFNGNLSNCTPFVCDNVTDGGTIGYGETICGIPGDPANMVNIQSPSGGSGNIEYLWLSSTEECPNNLSLAIPGATGPTYDPGPINEPTWFVRCSRRENCTTWIESNCIYKDVTPNVNATAQVTSNYNGADISCFNAADGSASVTVTQGTAPYQYNWSNGQSSSSINGLTAGTYNVTITDDKNCTTVASVTLDQPVVVGVSTNITSNYNGAAISCNGLSDGSVSATASGGTGAYTYTWNTGQTGASQSGLPAGTYTVIASDINGCTATSTVIIEDPDPLQAQADVISDYNGEDISCTGANDGVALVTTNGGVTPYSYSWSNGQSTQQVSGLAPGTYGVTITDANGCSTASSVSLTEPTPVAINVSVSSNYNGQDVSCNGAADGAATAVGSGGTAPYTYQWDAAANFQTTATASNLSAGTYGVTVYDANGCGQGGTVTLQEPTALDATAEVISDYSGAQISCTGASDGLASVAASGGTAPYTYEWSNGQTGQNATGLSAATYTVTITDVNNCQVVRSVTLIDPLPVSLTAQITSDYNGAVISCFGENDGQATATAAGGTGAYAYTWSTGQTGAVASNLTAGTYTVIVSDINGCTADATVVLEEPELVASEAMVISDYNDMDISCHGANDGIALVTTTGGVTPYTYTWSNGQSTQQIENLSAGTYDVTVADANGCTTTASISLTEPTAISSTAEVTSVYNEGVDISTLGGNDGAAIAYPSGGTAPYTYQWDDAAFQTTQSATNLTAGTYTVLISDANGCTTTSEVTLLDPAKIGDKIFEDLNGNGIQDAGEPGVEGVLITLTGTADNGTLVTRSTATDSNGNYNFDGLLPGSYKITINVPAAYLITYVNEGGNESTDSDINPLDGMSEFVSVDYGQYYADLDGGLYLPITIGDYVWLDCNKNGIQDAGEEALGFVPVTLNGFTGNGTAVSISEATLADGSYQFVNLKPGTYVVSFGFPNTPTGLDYSPKDQGSDDTVDSDVNGSGDTDPITLVSGDNSTNIDAGFIDATPPAISPEASDLTVECDGAGNQTTLDNWLASYGGAAATDNYSNITWTNNFTGLSDDCGETGTATVIFTATDECGNSSQTTATFTIEDTTSPALNTLASDLNVECDGGGNGMQLTAWLESNGGATASDICSGIEWTHDFTILSDDCGATGSATVTFTATDACGNSSQTTAAFTIQDNTAPDLVNPAQALTVECDGQGNLINLNAWLDNNAGALASDVCGSVTWSNNYNDNLSDLCGGTGSVTVTFTATDECGNFSETVATFTIEDTTAPSIGIPASDLSFECDGGGNNPDLFSWLDSQGGAGATDICGGVNWTNDFAGLSDDCGATGSATVTFTATDECGNTAQTTATITIVDNVPPNIAQIATDLTVECDGLGNQNNLNAWLQNNAGALATDVCGTVAWTNDYNNNISDDCGSTGQVTVTFTATDECGNSAQTTASFIIEDTTSPSIGIPALNMTVECDGGGNGIELNNWLDAQGGAGATDICGGVSWTNDFVAFSDDCGATGSATVTFTATDECGNTEQTTATFTIEDTTAPEIVNAASDLTVECDGQGNQINLNAWLDNYAGALAADVCGPAISWSHDFNGLSDDCADTGSATVTFTATDECGNTSQTTATFTIIDTTPPNIGINASDLTVECDGGGNGNELIGWLDNQGGAGATDICSNVNWTNDFTALSNDCGATGSTTVTFTATDDCGNTAQTTAIFTIIDTTVPAIVSPAADLTVECDGQGNTVNLDAWLQNRAGALASDLCGGVTWSDNFTGLSDDCGGTGSATVTFTATDDCGNTSETTATFTIEDTTAPNIGIGAQDLTVECDGGGNGNQLFDWLDNNGGAGAIDICGSITWSHDFPGNLSDDCGATGSTTVTFTVTDECGNTAATTATFTIEDTTAPDIVQEAQNLTVECDGQNNQVNFDAWISNNAGALASDLCGTNIVWTNNYNNQPIPACDSIQVTFTATDECANTSQTAAWFIVQDSQAPELLGVPQNLDLECDEAIPAMANVTANDICDANVNLVSNETSTQGQNPAACDFYNYEIVRTWTATDACGNITEESQTITISDNNAPAITQQAADVEVECDGAGNQAALNDWLNNNASANATDNCSAVNWTNDYNGNLISDCGATGAVTVTFTASDACGNETTTTATFTILDTSDPTLIGVPADAAYECDQAIPSAANVTATDVCDTNVEVTFNESSTQGNDPTDCSFYNYELTRNWLATDACGNTSEESQTITISDNTIPQLTAQAQNLEVECDGSGNTAALNDWLNNNAAASATDNCSNIVWSNDYSGNLNPDCGATGAVEVTFTASDACGNVVTTTATFTIIDSTSPDLLSVPADTEISCDEAVPAMATVNATDICDTNVEVEASESSTQGNNPDDCNYYNYEITRSWLATDDCGNTSIASQVITVTDNSAPEISAAAQNEEVECNGSGNLDELNAWLNSNGGAAATDNCSEVTWTNNYNGNLNPDCGASGEVLITFTASDACGNETVTTATFTIVDTTDPDLLNVPADVAINCDEALPTPANVTATDLCDANVEVVLEESSTQVADPNNCAFYEYELTRTWTATDDCGNTTTAQQFIAVSDDQAPVVSQLAQNTEVECNPNSNAALTTWLTNHGGAVANDNCSAVSWTNDYNGNFNIDCGEAGSVTVIFTASDVCGNSSQTEATFTVIDTTEPDLLNIPADASISCDEPLPTAATVVATDLCDSNVDVSLDESSSQGSDPADCSFYNYEIIRTWTATDDCGNTSSESQTITVTDETNPQITQFAQNAAVDCDGNGNQAELSAWLNNYGGAAATDNCSSVNWTNNYNGNFDLDCGASGSVEVIFTATDICGNQNQTTATFSIVDDTDPELLNVPANLSLDCSEALPPAANVVGNDACDTDVEVVLNTSDTQGNDPNDCDYYTYEITRTWTAIDDCGNSSTAQQIISISDNAAPQLLAEAQDAIVECDGSGNNAALQNWLNNQGNASAEDDCSEVYWINDFTGSLPNDCGASGSVEVTFTAQDACGNPISTTATFTIEDSEAPDLLSVPANATISCDATLNPATVTATDLCDTNVEVTLDEVSTQGSNPSDCSYYNYELVRTWTATDDCGNTATASQTIQVEDNSDPEISTPAQNQTVECDGNGNATALSSWLAGFGGAAATDNCSAVNWTNNYNGNLNIDCAAAGSISVIFTVTDICGNSNTTQATFTIEDTEGPDLLNVPADATANCDDIPAMANVITNDICDSNAEIVDSESSTQGTDPDDCSYYNYVITRTWTATDECGNTAIASQLIAINDNTAPEITAAAIDVEVECDGNGNQTELSAWINNFGGAAATDNCSNVSWSHDFSGNYIIDCGNAGEVSVTFRAKDACGNETSTTATFKVIDTGAPEILGAPSDMTVECDDIPNPPTLTANDLCDNNPSIVYGESILPAPDCAGDAYQIIRTWTATDACGNSSEVTQTVDVEDSTPPQLLGVPADVIAPCNEIPEVPQINDDITATDNCDVFVQISFNEQMIPGDCGNSFTLVRTWTAVDNCGNETSESQNISIGDDSPPVFTEVPSDISMECPAQIEFGLPTATDDCGDPVITFEDEEIAGACPQSYTIVRTWSATDECGNVTTVSRTMEIEDTTEPFLTGVPADVTIDLGAGETIPTLPDVIASDLCDINVEVILNEVETAADCGYVLTRTWSAIDACGNEAVAAQQITVIESLSVAIDGIAETCAGTAVDLGLNLNDPLNTYSWSSSGGQLDNTTSSQVTFNADVPGTYTITVAVATASGCEGEDTFVVTVAEAPQGTASGNGPLCVGETVLLEAEGGTAYSWTGPDGFSSTEQNPSISNAVLANAGAYTVVISTDDCDATETIFITINTAPIAQISGSTDLCEGENLQLIASGGSQYEWAGPDGFNSSTSTANVNNVTAINAGTYSVTVTDFNGCVDVMDVLVSVGVGATPNADNNGPLCVDQTLELYASPDGAEYEWTGPNGFTSTEQNPVITNISEDYDGEFTVMVTQSTCTGTATTTVEVKTGLNGFISSNGPVCEGETIELSAGGGTTVAWVGPDGFTSSDDDPTIENATLNASGIYVAIIGTGICKDTLQTEVIVYPALTADFNIVPVDCDNLGSINIGVSGGSGNYTYDWADLPGTDDSEDRDDLQPGTYDLIITDVDGGCTFEINNLVVNNTCDCDADAGDVQADANPVCLEDSEALISATSQGNQVVPTGYTIVYVLTTGADLTIVQTSTTPSFDVFDTGDYTIHTLVYDPATLDLSIVVPGTTTAGEVLALLQQGGGDICAALDVAGAPVNVTQPEATIVSNNAETCDDCNGAVSLSPSNYNYSWSDGGSGADRDDLCSGVYTITITDGDGCTNELTLTVDESCGCEAPIVTNIVVVEADCGESNGTATLQIPGNPADYAYQWDPNIGTSLGAGNGRTDLPGGIYSVTIVDPLVADCETVTEFAVGINDGPEAVEMSTFPATCGAANGQATIMPATYDYIWTFDNTISNSRTDLEAGAYQVVVIDPFLPQCPNFITVIIEQENNLELQEIINVEPDCGEANGIVTITIVSGGSGNQTYEWSDDPTANQAVRNDLAAGTYSVTVTDQVSGCASTVTFTLNDNVAGANVNVASEFEVSCIGSEDGEANYLLSFEPGFVDPATTIITDASGQIYNNGDLAPGSYCIVVEDGNGCIAGSGCFDITEPTAMDVDIMLTNKDCDAGGTITLQVIGGNGGYTYDWADLPGSDDPQNRTDLAGGIYEITISDINGCTAVATNLTIEDECGCEGPVVNNIVVIEATCFSANGMATINMAGNAADFEYDWSPAVSTSHVANNILAGTYTVNITDPADPTCVTVEVFTVGTSDGPQATLVSSSPANCLAADGEATFEPDSYTYTWSDLVLGNSRDDLQAGVYQITVEDATGCIDVISLVIDQDNDLELDVIINTEPDCGAANGVVTIDVNNGSGDYSYSWGAGATQSNLMAGVYDVTVVDNASGCSANIVFSLTENVAGAEIDITSPDDEVVLDCAGDSNGEVDFGVDYSNDFAQPAVITILNNLNEQVFNGNLGAGTYCIQVTDANGCLAAAECFEVIDPDPINVDVAILPFTCLEGGSIDLTVSGGNGDYTFDWADLAGADDSEDRSDLQAGVYNVTITDGEGCTAVANNLAVIDDCNPTSGCEEPEVITVVKVEPNCGDTNGSATIMMAGDEANYTYEWSPNVSDTYEAANLGSDVYTVTITDINDDQCFTILSFSLANVDGPIAEILSTTPATCSQANGTAVLSPVTYQYEWCNGAIGFNVGNLPAGVCFVTVTDFFTGCTNIIEVEIETINILQVEAEIIELPDCGQDNGEVTINVSGGSADYSYAWSDGGVSPTRDDLEAGVYSVTVTDNGVTGCMEVVTFTLLNDIDDDEGATVNLAMDSIYVSCVGANDAFADFTVDFDINFEDPADIVILDVNGEPQINGNLSPGMYCVVVIDGNGCLVGDACFDVLSPMNIDLDISLMNQDCDTLGVIELDVTGGTGPYTFDWEDLPGADDPQNRTGLVAGGYSVTVSDANGCTAFANMLAITNECTGCPSPDTVEMILPVFTVDSVCFVLESCFDTTIVTTYSLTTGGSAGASVFGNWVVDNEGCLFYQANGIEGVGVDTICMIANNNGLLDTTCVIVTIVPACNGLLDIDSLELSTFDCEAGGSFCLPIPLIEILDYQFTDNGQPYAGGFMGCNFDTIQSYLLQPLLNIAPVGPYELGSWTVNGMLFDIDTFFTLPQLVDSMNLWDPVGNWTLTTSNTIVGGDLSNTYGILDITQLITMANAMLPLSSTEIPNGTLMTVDTGFHELIVIELATGCADTITLGVECQECPTLYSGPETIESFSCADPVDVCLDISIDDIFNYIITDNGDLYTDGFMGCDFDSLVTYLTIGFNTPGNYTLDSWMINGNSFSIANFTNLQELADSMNVWDPAANWMVNGLLLVGGDYTNTYGNINISINGVPSAMANPNLQLIPNGGAISLMPGDHEVILTDTITGCMDTINLTITCDDCLPFYSGPDTLNVINCPQPAAICLDLSLDDLTNYILLDNGLPYNSTTLGCNFDSLITYLTVGFNTMGGYTVDDFEINGSGNFLGFFTTVDELVAWMNTIDPTGNWEVNGLLIVGGDPANTYGNLVISELGMPVATVEPNLQLIPNGISIELDEGFHEVIVVDTVIGCTDTFTVQVNCINDLLPDTIYLDVMIGFTDTFCLNTDLFPGMIDTIYNICEDESGTNAFVSVIDSTSCIEYTGILIGQDTACIVICDDLNNCDTTIIIIDVIPPMIDTIMTTVVLSDTDTLCFDVSELAGMDYTVTNYCDDQSGTFVTFDLSPDTICIEYTGVGLGTDTACIEICDELGACDTTILIVTTILGIGEPPIAVDDDTTAVKGTGVDVDVLGNDTINGELSSISILTDPLNGTAFVNPDFTITYIPDVDFCGSIDSFEYILTTSTGSDTAWVFIDIQCDELIIFSGFSPNEDGVNDYFAILGIENFPDNEVSIFNRWGNRVFFMKGYTNDEGWEGTWEGKHLPDGTYFYVVEDGEGRKYSGYVQLQR